MRLENYIRAVEDFPIEGIIYRDIQPLLENEFAFKSAITELRALTVQPDYWVGIDSRGFIFASALSVRFGGGLKLIRKKGKLPNENLHSISYGLEYGEDVIEMKEGSGTVVIVDDVYATGGTMTAAKTLCESAGYKVLDTICLLDVGIVKHDTRCAIYY